MPKRNLLFIALAVFAVLAGCAGGDPPRPSSPRDAANPRAPEPRFDPAANPLVRTIATAPGPAAPESAPAPPASANPHAGHAMPPASGSMAPMPMPVPMKQP